MGEREYRGEQGHFIRKCHWHICTHVNGVRVSTVGEIVGDEIADVGDGKYETMVFELDEHGDVSSYVELARCHYGFRADAVKGHEAWCRRFEQ